MPQSSSSGGGGGRFSKHTLSLLEPKVHSVIKDSLGFSEPSLLQSAMNCVQEGGGHEEIKKRLCSVLDNRKATKLAAKIFQSVDDFCIGHDLPTMGEQARKRRGDEGDQEDSPALKVPKMEPGEEEEDQKPVIMSSEQIRQMMANARKEIQQRRQQLSQFDPPEIKVVGPQRPTNLGQDSAASASSAAPAGGDDKAQALAALQAQIASRMSKIGMEKLPMPEKPTPVILNSMGRTVDAAGQEIQLAHHVPTLKANLRAKRRDEMKEHAREGQASHSQAAVQESKFFDARVGAGANKGGGVRVQRRQFKFNEPGRFQMEGQRLRMKAQLERLQADISTIARKTGITSATQLAKLVPKDVGQRGRGVPDLEWWDSHIMVPESSYAEPALRRDAITNLIEHPIQMMPLEPNKPVHVPVFLTKKEMKKLRRQNRREAWKEKQDKIRIGLLPPDEPKVKMSNLMRVLGMEAVQDPTKIEAQVRDQMAKRLAGHEKANAERKLTTEQKKDKMVRKIKEDTSCGVHVAVYRVKSLANPAKRFKVETNAKQLLMTGCLVVYEDVNVVVVEGGPKQQKKYRQLMLNRIKWDEEVYKDKDGVEADNKCVLVWEGQTKERTFGEMRLKQCPTESFARDYFKTWKVEHYWDQAYSGAVLEVTDAM